MQSFMSAATTSTSPAGSQIGNAGPNNTSIAPVQTSACEGAVEGCLSLISPPETEAREMWGESFFPTAALRAEVLWVLHTISGHHSPLSQTTTSRNFQGSVP